MKFEIPDIRLPKIENPNMDWVDELQKQRAKDKRRDDKRFWAMAIIATLSLIVTMWQLAISSKSSQPQPRTETINPKQQNPLDSNHRK